MPLPRTKQARNPIKWIYALSLMHPENGKKGQKSKPKYLMFGNGSRVPAEVGTFSVSRTLRAYQIRYAFGSPTASQSTNTLRTAHKSITFLRSPIVGPLPPHSIQKVVDPHGGTPKVMHLPCPCPILRAIEFNPIFPQAKGRPQNHTPFRASWLCEPCGRVRADEKNE